MRRHGIDAHPALVLDINRMRALIINIEHIDDGGWRGARFGAWHVQHQNIGAGAIVCNRAWMTRYRQRGAFDLRDASGSVTAKALGICCFFRGPCVAVIFEPALQLVFRLTGRQRRQRAILAAHRHQFTLARDQHIGPGQKWRGNQACEDKANADQTPTCLPQRQPHATHNHQHERQRWHGRQVSNGAWQHRHLVGAPAHGIDAPTHWDQANCLQPERHQHQRGQCRWHHNRVADRNSDEIGDHRVLLTLVKLIRREWRHCDARNNRRKNDAAKKHQHPQHGMRLA